MSFKIFKMFEFFFLSFWNIANKQLFTLLEKVYITFYISQTIIYLCIYRSFLLSFSYEYISFSRIHNIWNKIKKLHMKTSDSKRIKNLSINPSFLFLLSSLFVLLPPRNELGHIVFKLRGSTSFGRAAAKSVAISPSTFFSGRN